MGDVYDKPTELDTISGPIYYCSACHQLIPESETEWSNLVDYPSVQFLSHRMCGHAVASLQFKPPEEGS